MIKFLFIYSIIATSYTAGYLFMGFWYLKKRFKASSDQQQYWQILKSTFLDTKRGQFLKKRVWNPFTFCLVFLPVFIFVSQFAFPLVLLSGIKRLMFGKSKLEIEALEEAKEIEEHDKKAADNLQNEDCCNRFDFTNN
jgi:hypothetical protein